MPRVRRQMEDVWKCPRNCINKQGGLSRWERVENANQWGGQNPPSLAPTGTSVTDSPVVWQYGSSPVNELYLVELFMLQLLQRVGKPDPQIWVSYRRGV
jgi:hypothetical protein